jgi:hypothetical protein
LRTGRPNDPCDRSPDVTSKTIGSGTAVMVATKLTDWVSWSGPKENRLQVEPSKYDALFVGKPVVKFEKVLT